MGAMGQSKHKDAIWVAAIAAVPTTIAAYASLVIAYNEVDTVKATNAALLADNQKLKRQLEEQIALAPDPGVLHRPKKLATNEPIKIFPTSPLSASMTLAYGKHLTTTLGGIPIAYVERKGPVMTVVIGNDKVPMVFNQPKPYLTADNRHCELTVTGLTPAKELTIYEACSPYAG